MQICERIEELQKMTERKEKKMKLMVHDSVRFIKGLYTHMSQYVQSNH